MNSFNPVFFDNHRYLAICKADRYFVFDASVYDTENNDRASCIATGKLASLPSLIGLVSAISNQLEYEYAEDNRNFWSMELELEELIYLYEKYVSSEYGIILFPEDSLA